MVARLRALIPSELRPRNLSFPPRSGKQSLGDDAMRSVHL